jgi:hypothetical protein
LAEEQFPLTKERVAESGWSWRESLQRTVGKETITSEMIPLTIKETPDTICTEVLRCVDCSRNYKIVPGELELYRRMNISIPHRCFYCRLSARLKRRNPFELWHRSCMCDKDNHEHTGKCPNEFETSYAPDRKEIVYCESCYLREVQ